MFSSIFVDEGGEVQLEFTLDVDGSEKMSISRLKTLVNIPLPDKLSPNQNHFHCNIPLKRNQIDTLILLHTHTFESAMYLACMNLHLEYIQIVTCIVVE